MALRVLIDGWELTGYGRVSGLGSVVRNLVRELDARDDLDVELMVSDPAAAPGSVRSALVRRHWPEGRKGTYEHELRLPLVPVAKPTEEAVDFAMRHTGLI